ncbi:MAG TPA: SDR family oxidoreductase [Conexibacter sp.]|jgi:nucleoside-diphosphate-sugar epimerase
MTTAPDAFNASWTSWQPAVPPLPPRVPAIRRLGGRCAGYDDGMRALVIGASGISGWNTARRLLDRGWTVAGVSRRPAEGLDGMTQLLVDVTDREATATALAGQSFTHLFYATWARQATEADNQRVNGAMLRNVLDAVAGSGTVKHVALVTGLKHYLGPFEAYGSAPADTPFREDQERLPFPNFYYDQEDILFETAVRDGFTWSVHRAHTMIGWALENAMNMGTTLAVYGTICREQGRPFVFPGSPEQYQGVTDLTDASLLAEQLEWSATTPAGANQALNIVNGDVFRWRRMWEVIAADLGVATDPYPGEARSLEAELEGLEHVWRNIVTTHALRPTDLSRVASAWHTDSDLGRPLEAFADMTKSRTLGFHGFRDSERSFIALFDRLRAERIIP